MSARTKVSIYVGPPWWFRGVVSKKQHESLMDAVFASDDARGIIHHVTAQQRDDGWEPPTPPRPKRLIAESGDYASLSEHAITNFPGLVQRLNPKELVLHNPPIHVQRHLERTYGAEHIKVERYAYPTIKRDTLVKFRAGFEDHLVGQSHVRDRMLSALYPMTKADRSTPMVVLFYGPSGVGKTETAKFINTLLGGDLMRRQFSMFQNEKFASYVFGGSHAEPSFAHELLDRSSGVILLDEFDKANAVFHSAFYELFDGGTFEDKNYRVELGASLIICTSNYASEKQIRDALGDALFSRFDVLIGFEPLTSDEVLEVIDRLVDARFASLNEEERGEVTADFIKEKLRPAANNAANIRQLGKLTEQMINTVLVRKVLERSEHNAEPEA